MSEAQNNQVPEVDNRPFSEKYLEWFQNAGWDMTYYAKNMRCTQQFQELFGDLPEQYQKDILEKIMELADEALDPHSCVCGTAIPLFECEAFGETCQVKLGIELPDECDKSTYNEEEEE